MKRKPRTKKFIIPSIPRATLAMRRHINAVIRYSKVINRLVARYDAELRKVTTYY